MSNTSDLDFPIACTLSAVDRPQRARDNVALFRRVTQAREEADGYAFAFPDEDAIAEDLFQFVRSEQACCSFITFALAFPAPHSVVWLTLTGGDGVKEMIREIFAEAIAPHLPLDSRVSREAGGDPES